MEEHKNKSFLENNPKEYDSRNTLFDTWVTSKGAEIEIETMSDKHIENTIKYFIKTGQDKISTYIDDGSAEPILQEEDNPLYLNLINEAKLRGILK